MSKNYKNKYVQSTFLIFIKVSITHIIQFLKIKISLFEKEKKKTAIKLVFSQ